MHLFGEYLTIGSALFLLLALGLALGFEFVNGFHDTANAVATVIYTNSLKPVVAVVWSGCWNLIGVLVSSGGIAFAILALLPVELVLNIGSGAGFAMVFALLISAIIWNVGTWYLGLPASSSHTLIGSIMGVGLANSMLTKGHVFGEGVNWSKVSEVFTSLLVSPIVGFTLAAVLLLAIKFVVRRPELFVAPEANKPPPRWIRALLILTCTGVSYSHGSNDGQKGMGLLMLILVGIVPAQFALNLDTDAQSISKLVATANTMTITLNAHSHAAPMAAAPAEAELSAFLKTTGKQTDNTFAAVSAVDGEIAQRLQGKTDLSTLTKQERSIVRSNIYLVSESIGKLDKSKQFSDKAEEKAVVAYKKSLDKLTKFIPLWVKIAVALALGCGTMIGWKRIVVTVGEKIGKDHLTYAQGASAELVTMATIMAANQFNLPVSTTHVLSSGVAGTMAANHSGLQMGTLRNRLIAWVLTLPVCVLLGATTFSAGFYVVFHVLGLK